jgi:hypothetical protein
MTATLASERITVKKTRWTPMVAFHHEFEPKGHFFPVLRAWSGSKSINAGLDSGTITASRANFGS